MSSHFKIWNSSKEGLVSLSDTQIGLLMDLGKNSVVKTHETDDDSTRRRVFTAILHHGSISAAQLADELELTPAAIRRHLDFLSEAGLIIAKEPRRRGPRGRGRPAKAYSLTESGQESVHNSYNRLALEAINELVRVGGPAGFDRLANNYFAPVGEQFAELTDCDEGLNRADALAEAFNTEGYVATVDVLPSGEQLCQYHCPVADVARAYPQLCEIETQLISGLLKSHVQRLATIAHGDGVCTTHIPKQPTRKT
jgi:predicted ArsR family transcriptional regulator